MRYMRDSFPMDLAPNYAGTGTGTIAVDTANTSNYTTGQPMPLTYGIPIPAVPNYSSGFAWLPVTGSTNSVWPNFRRGYIESWNLFVQRVLGKHSSRTSVTWAIISSASRLPSVPIMRRRCPAEARLACPTGYGIPP